MLKLVDIDAQLGKTKAFKINGRKYMAKEPTVEQVLSHNERMIATFGEDARDPKKVVEAMVESITAVISDLDPKEVRNLPRRAVQTIITEIYGEEVWEDQKKKAESAESK